MLRQVRLFLRVVLHPLDLPLHPPVLQASDQKSGTERRKEEEMRLAKKALDLAIQLEATARQMLIATLPRWDLFFFPLGPPSNIRPDRFTQRL